ncbi:MAG: SMP-30/gluconolactonase/LRE family protein [Verrucomicrobiales bacterium]|nr:SMP-30/gluconolactonase/LRE family protein [Verrucomicrobiales bacterium]
MSEFEPIGDTKAQWGEGPIWWDGKFLWVDIEGHLVIEFDAVTGSETIANVGERVGTVVPRASGGLVIAGDSGFHFLDLTTGATQAITDPESDLPDNRFNDGKCDPAGRFWAGTMHLSKPRQPVGAMWRLDADHSVHRMFDDVTVSNGLVWNRAADTMFYIDSPTDEVVAFDFDLTTGAISGKRTVVDTAGFPGTPDGMAIDEDDNLWVAMCHGGRVMCFDSSNGKTLEILESPTLEVTAPAFGGDDLSDLYVTTGQSDKTVGDDLAGRTIVKQPGVKGVPAFAFAG